MNATADSTAIVAADIRSEQDVVQARKLAREVSAALGFKTAAQTQVATAVSEIARNAFQYAGGGAILFSTSTEPNPADSQRPRQVLSIEVTDNGPGIARLNEILDGSYRSESGLGIGIIGTRRLMDRVDVASRPGSTRITLRKILPAGSPVRSAPELKQISEKLSQLSAAGPLDEIQIQNQGLLAAMDEARKRNEELVRVNRELAETNTGVLALYDELETLNRIGVMLASKLQLKELIQSIVDVTTSLTDAELGAFFFAGEDEGWKLYATAGSEGEALDSMAQKSISVLFPPDFVAIGMLHLRDTEAGEIPAGLAQIAEWVKDRLAVRSFLAVPVLQAGTTLIGAFVFASGKAGAFSERSERILISVANQAAVGIENARLFQTVTAASAAKDEFFASLSHELRTPLNPALAIISSLNDDPRIPPEIREDIASVARNIRLEARLIDDLLDFNRLIRGKLELVKEVVDFHALIRSVVQICREDIDQKQLHLECDAFTGRSMVFGDAGRLQQVLWNILKNAIKFTPPGGSIVIRTAEKDDRIETTITDTGKGIDRDSIGRIFNAFDQGERPTSNRLGGLGLGLSIARGFVELHSGNIWASSEGEGKGATITISLPLSNAAPAQPSAAPASPSSANQRNTRILLVDDHADTLEGISRLLSRRGFQITPASTAAAAVAAAQRQPFDLLISDVGLPDSSGLELVSMILKIQTIPAIALSGYGMGSDVAESRQAGFQIHLTKPVDFNQLSEAIETLTAAS